LRSPALQRADQRIQLGNNVRYFPSTLPNVRAIDALNYTVVWNPNVDPGTATLGFLSQDRNNPRDMQIGARFSF
jgi:hypothetical protein